MVLDPTICFERDTNQALQINDDKRAKYVPCLPYLSEKYGISLYNWDVTGLLFGAWGFRPVYVIDVYKLTPSNGPKERSRRARDLTVASDNLSAIEFRPGDFFFNVEPVIRNEASHRKIVFRVGILA
ncbi:hypothetical protein ANN_05370 [Periplaneta americana]|uniref:Uncharacterized protein n=1 Tax=Periplaneta americana TaxID=6978 RepID=A0ABQ8TAX2_PERAM|nr:hypothetical protein ANN_05370 [Periplaneta americana]